MPPAAAGGQASSEYVLTLSCPDRTGIVHAVAAYLHEAGCTAAARSSSGDLAIFGDPAPAGAYGTAGSPGT